MFTFETKKLMDIIIIIIMQCYPKFWPGDKVYILIKLFYHYTEGL